MRISGWGNYPQIEATSTYAKTTSEIKNTLLKNKQPILARGLGRSYGDSALADAVIDLTKFNFFLSFNDSTGELTCTSGTSLADILDVFTPKGWFLPVTPGTKYVTVGGAIASDVHGKNHHLSGCFSNYVVSLTLMLADGSVLTCSTSENIDLFRATCGGMGLTGIIITATIKLMPIRSVFIDEVIYKTRDLKETLEMISVTNESTYSAAWIDCLARGNKMGRGLLMLGDHAGTGSFISEDRHTTSLPFHLPSYTLNRFSIGLFNRLYFHRVSQRKTTRTVFYDPFFYPLDSINNWNRLYGKAGFTQYQFVLPKHTATVGLKAVLEKITDSQKGSFLAVLKATGAENHNYLSFPLEGLSLALDFKIEPSLFDLLNRLDEIILHYGGRLYLTKDVRMSRLMFQQSYPQWEAFAQVRIKYHLSRFNSLQSIRLGL